MRRGMQDIRARRQIGIAALACAAMLALASDALGALASPGEPPTLPDLARLVAGRDYPIYAAVVVGLVTRLCQEGTRLPDVLNVDKNWRAPFAMILGQLSGAAEHLIFGVPWSSAAAGGVPSSLIATSGHDVLVKGLLRGLLKVRDVPIPWLAPLAPLLRRGAVRDDVKTASRDAVAAAEDTPVTIEVTEETTTTIPPSGGTAGENDHG